MGVDQDKRYQRTSKGDEAPPPTGKRTGLLARLSSDALRATLECRLIRRQRTGSCRGGVACCRIEIAAAEACGSLRSGQLGRARWANDRNRLGAVPRVNQPALPV